MRSRTEAYVRTLRVLNVFRECDLRGRKGLPRKGNTKRTLEDRESQRSWIGEVPSGSGDTGDLPKPYVTSVVASVTDPR
jgi:hypothetical protein